MENKIRVGIIGVHPERGWATIAHIPALKALKEFELKGISNRNAEQAKVAGAKFGVPLVFSTNSELINSPEIDLVVIAVKVPEHRALVIEAINAGKAIYCEWPLGNGLEETIELTALAKAKGVHAAIGLQSRAVPAIAYIKDLIKEGFIGEVLSTTMIGSGIIYGEYNEQAMAYAMDIKNDAGMIYATFGHAVDALNDVLGEFTELNATTINRRKTTIIAETGESIPMTAFDQIAVSGVLESGAIATVHYRGGMNKGTNFHWEINGTKGDLVITAAGGHPAVFPLTIQGNNEATDELQITEVPSKYQFVEASELYPINYNIALNYSRFALDLKNGTNLAATFADAVVRHQMITAIETAGSTGIRQGLKN